jgi:CubicO group peptidase (beta-lactamase class C family)
MQFGILRSSLLCVAVVVALPAPVCGDQPRADSRADWKSEIDALFANWNRPDSPGCAVGVVERGELTYSKGFGSANLDFQAPNSPQTVFEVASFTKSFTSACIALLMDEGKMSPDDDLRKFVPEMHAFDPPIRIRDLVRCRSGLWDQVSVPILVGWENAPLQHPHTEADFFSLLIGQKVLPFKPGERFAYSSGDYFLLGVIVKRISGQSLPQFAHRRIFEPLGMTRTYIEEAPTLVVENRAVGHYKRGGDQWHQWRPTAYWAGGAGLKTCVEDLYRWDQNFARNRLPEGKRLGEFFHDGSLLSNGSCLDLDAFRKENDPETNRELTPAKYRGLRRRQFTGGAWGTSAAMTQFPDQEVTMICLSNCDEIAPWTMNRHIADLILRDQLLPQPPKNPSADASTLPEVKLADADLLDKVGHYRMKNTRMIWEISLHDGSLQLTDHLLKSHPLRSLSATRFDPAGDFYPTTQFVFARPTSDSPMSFTSEWDEPYNRGKLEFTPVEIVNPTANQLQEYAGEYVSDELAATYRFTIRENQLWLRINSRRWEQLDATVRDEFIPHLREPSDARIISFLRSENGAVDGLSVEYYRVKDVRFQKR